MLVGSVAGGIVAQVTTSACRTSCARRMLGVTLAVAFLFMHDLGLHAAARREPVTEVRAWLRGAVDGGLTIRRSGG